MGFAAAQPILRAGAAADQIPAGVLRYGANLFDGRLILNGMS